MNLYRISQSVNNGCDTYDSAIVAAESEEQARQIKPGSLETWACAKDVSVELIGTARPDTRAGVILASFNAG